jgi:hypothetical protein
MQANTVSPITPDTTVMTLLGNGNVGIGTTSPSKKLEILSTQGNGLRVNNGSVSYDISVYTDNTLRILQSGGYGSIVDATGHLTIGNSTGIGSRDLFVRRIIGTPDASGAGLSINGAASQSANYINVTSSGGTTGNIFNILSNGNVGIGTTTPSERLTVSGNISATGNITCTGHLAAATKSFKIPHQTKAGYLQYGVVESNEHGVYVRGKTSDDTIILPDHWDWLVESDSVTVTLTPYGSHQPLYIISADNKKVVVGGAAGEYHYVVYGTRKDVEALVVETAE